MNMKNKNPIIVVEGKTDAAIISSLYKCDVVITNGSAVSRETIDYLKRASLSHEIIVFTDPDSPGERIRSIIDQNVDNVKHAFIEKKKAIKKHKVGVAEASPQAIVEALEHLIPNYTSSNGSLSLTDVEKLGLSGSDNATDLRNFVADYFHIGHVNCKTFLKRLNALGVTKDDLEKVINGRE